MCKICNENNIKFDNKCYECFNSTDCNKCYNYLSSDKKSCIDNCTA